MWEIQSQALLVLVLVAACVAAVTVVVLWSRHRAETGGLIGRSLKVLGRTVLVALVVGLAGLGLFLNVNNSFGFYSSWNDLLGISHSQDPKLSTSGLTSGGGKLEKITVKGTASQGDGQVLIWLPPQYDDPAWKDYKFPVVMMLPGQTPPGPLYKNYQFGQVASQAITSGDVKPFVGVFPPIVIAPPRDTECINVPSGPQAESWLTKDVADAVTKQLRVQSPGPHWSVMGWSTGGFCAANLALRNPHLFGASVPIGGTFIPYLDKTTGDLFGGDQQLQDANTPLKVYQTNKGTGGVKMLIVASKTDQSSWAQSQQMIQQATGDPNVSSLIVADGGHNYHTYQAALVDALKWLSQVGVLNK